MHSLRSFLLAAAIGAALVIAGCGSSGSNTSAGAGNGGSGTTSGASGTTSAGSSGGGAGALSAESKSAATGDIPDTQVFLVFTNHAAGYSMEYPEGWTQKGSGPDVTIADKNNIVHVVIGHGSAPTTASLTAQLQSLQASNPGLTFSGVKTLQLPAGPAVAATYTTQSSPNPVTGKRVTLIVDRYELRRGSRVATVDLGTPKGVDNVDAYKKIVRSFHWK